MGSGIEAKPCKDKLYPCWWVVWGGMVLLGCLLARPAQAGEGSVVLETNQQLFSVLAAINAAGYNAGLGINSGDNTRQGVRAVLAKENIPILPKLREFYAAHRVGLAPGKNLGQYVSLALLLGPPPDFKFTIARQDLPPDAADVQGLVPLLRQFYEQADLADLWARLQPQRRALIRRYSTPVRRTLALTDAYLRFATGAYLGRTYRIYLDLLGAPDQVQGRIYRDQYDLVITPSKKIKLREIRYQYLHFLLDPLAVKYAPEIQKVSSLAAIARKAPALGPDFKEDFSLLLTECLIRATELRMDKTPPAQAQKDLQRLTASGLILAPYFYKALGAFEKQDASMDVFYPTMLRGINPVQEAAELASVKFAPPPRAVLAAPVSEKTRLLDQGDNDIYQGKYQEALAPFGEVLKGLDPKSARALFGMAVAESNLMKPDLAEKYFQQTLASAHDPRLVTWSHIYLGRIADINGDRKEALAEYRAASVTAAAYPEALSAVQQGLQHPFGTQ
jgi:tetratricopeptide (TPR) repeat protein